MYLNRITLIGFLGGDARSEHCGVLARHENVVEERRRDVGISDRMASMRRFGRLAEFVGSLTRGAHVPIEGGLRSHEYQREIVVADQRTAISQRIWEIRVDSVLKLDRAAKRESTGDCDQEVPR